MWSGSIAGPAPKQRPVAQAEQRLKNEQPGVYLVRSSPRQTGFVLSMVVPKSFCHFQIKQMVDSRGG